MISIIKIWALIVWIISFIAWAITEIRAHHVSKANSVSASEFYSFMIVVFLLFTMICAIILNILGVK